MDYFLDLLSLSLTLGAAAVVVAYLVEEAGFIHAGSAGLLGAGAYASVLTCNHLNLSTAGELFVTSLAGAILGLCLHLLTRKLRAAHFALLTMGAAVVIHGVLLNWTSLTGGPMGVVRKSNSHSHGAPEGLVLSGLLIVVIVVAVWLPRTGVGLCIRALRDDEDLAEDLRLRPEFLRLLLLVGSSVVLSVLGGFYSERLRFIDPSSFSLRESITILAMALVIPIRSPLRGIAGGFLFVFLPEALRLVGLPSAAGAQIRQGIFGLLLLSAIWKGRLPMDRFIGADEQHA